MERFWVLQEPGDAAPFAVVSVGEDGLVRRYVPGMGLIDWPYMGSWIFGAELGRKEINRAQAVILMKAGVGELDPDVDYSDQWGTAPPVVVPELV